MGKVYYNEFDPAAAAWLRELMANNLIAQGDVDERSIKDVRGDELRGYTQCHFFAGIGIWSAALRRNGWDDDRPVWTGSCPCQPFSAAGKGLGFEDPRHLWPDWLRLIRDCNPLIIFGEQVASAPVAGASGGLESLYQVRGGEGTFGIPHLQRKKLRRSTTALQNLSTSVRENVAISDAARTGAETSFGEGAGAGLQPRIPSEKSSLLPDRGVSKPVREGQLSVRSGSACGGNSVEDRQGGLRDQRSPVRPEPNSRGARDSTGGTLVGQAGPEGGLRAEQRSSGVLCGERSDVELGGGSSVTNHGSVGEESDLNVASEPWASTPANETSSGESVWLDLVFLDLENASYACAALDLPAAGFAQGAHIRQRIYWVADRHNTERWSDVAGGNFGDWPQAGRIEGYGESGTGGAVGGLADGASGLPGDGLLQHGGEHGQQSKDSGAGEWLGDNDSIRLEGRAAGGGQVVSRRWKVQGGSSGFSGSLGDVDWLLCRDGKLRPVETGTFPLAAAHPGRLGLLRGYGNSLDLETASNFIGAYMEASEIADTLQEFA